MRTGYVDLQVNGYGGVSFSSLSLTADDVRKVADAPAAKGTVAFCPTVITAAAPVYDHVLPILGAAARPPDLAGRILGIHLEGPFISREDGAVGAHPKAHVLPPLIASLERLLDLAGGATRLLTVAPEQPGATELIAHARSAGIVVSIGHTLAGADDIQRAIDAGASLSTHLGNGCPGFMHRHDNPIWPQLAAGGLTAMIITDGHHLPPAFIRTVLAAKGPGRVIVTSDAAPVAGMPPGNYEMLGTKVTLEPDGRVRNLLAPTLAGSSTTMCECMAYLEAGISGPPLPCFFRGTE